MSAKLHATCGAAKNCALVLLFLFACAAVRAEERILAYDSTITVRADGSLAIHESIRVHAEGRRIKRGIFRDFPTRYTTPNGRPVTVGFAFRSAQRDGADEEWRTEERGNGIRIYLGNANRSLPPGDHTYEIDYLTDRQLGYFFDHDEIYWNVTGSGWDFAIEQASAQVLLPDEVPRNRLTLEAYTGPQGARGTAYAARVYDGAPYFQTTRPLDRNEGLTIVVMWPKGYLRPQVESSEASASAARLRSSVPPPEYGTFSPSHGIGRAGNLVITSVRPAYLAFGGLAVLLVYYFGIWNRIGRDPPGRIPIPEYEPPTGISPGGMRFVLDMKYDDRCFAADVLNLAVKGHLTIQEYRSGMLNTKREFTLLKRESPEPQALSAEERTFLTKIFADGPRLELRQENYARVRDVKGFHRRLLKNRFMPGFFRVNGGWHALGIVISLAIVGALVLCADRDVLVPWYFTTPLGLATVGAAVIGLAANGLFGWLLKAPTVTGRATMDHVRGFKMYLSVAEGEDLKRVSTPPPPLTPALYHAYLPAALGLGVEQKWSERFARVFALQPPGTPNDPSWYDGSNWDSRHLSDFAHGLSDSFSDAISSSSTAPGSDSGGGGGGSSGGGGGGGGGGGW